MSPSLVGKSVIHENSYAFKLNKLTIATLYTLNFHYFLYGYAKSPNGSAIWLLV